MINTLPKQAQIDVHDLIENLMEPGSPPGIAIKFVASSLNQGFVAFISRFTGSISGDSADSTSFEL